MTTFDPRSQAWIGLSPDEIVRRVRCEADDAPDEGDSSAQIWRHACDTILLRMGKHPSQSPTPDGVIKERGEEGRDPSGQAAQQSPSPDGLGPSGEHPSRITVEGIEHLLWELSLDQDTEFEDVQIFKSAWSRLQQYRPEARRIIFASAGHWSAWSEEELDSDPSDPLVGRTTEWFVGFWRTGEPEADTYVRTGSGQSAERIAREIAADLNEMVSLTDRARDQRAEREDAQRPRPEAASPVRAAEAPASPPDTPSSQESGVGETEGWQLIATAPFDAPYTADMPDEAEGDGMGWAISDDDDRLLFLVWWEQEAAGRWTVTKWHPLPAAPRPSQREG